MNTWVEVMDVEPGYPKKEDGDGDGDDTNPDPPSPDPTPNGRCDIDESYNDMGPGMCLEDSMCKGDRVCSEGFWYCIGYSNCADDYAEESVAKCQINETFNPWGPSECTHEFHCKGDRTCGSDLKC